MTLLEIGKILAFHVFGSYVRAIPRFDQGGQIGGLKIYERAPRKIARLAIWITLFSSSAREDDHSQKKKDQEKSEFHSFLVLSLSTTRSVARRAAFSATFLSDARRSASPPFVRFVSKSMAFG